MNIYIYINIYKPTNMISVCQWWSCTYSDFFSCPWCGGMLSYGHLIESVNCMFWHAVLSWGLNVDHWLVAVIVWPYCHSALCSHCHLHNSCLWPSFFFSFFDPLCTSIYSFKGDKGCFNYYLKKSGRCSKKMMFFTGMFILLFVLKGVFIEYLGLNVFAFCFGRLQSAFQILIVHSSGLKKVLFSKG